MKQLQLILKEKLEFFFLQTQLFFKDKSTIKAGVLPARWALIPVKNNNRILKNKSQCM